MATFLRWRLDAALPQVVTLRHLLKQVTMSTLEFKIHGNPVLNLLNSDFHSLQILERILFCGLEI